MLCGRPKAFFFVAAGVLMLVGAFHLGARSAQGQSVGSPIAAIHIVGNASNSSHDIAAILENGDVWGWPDRSAPSLFVPPEFFGNLFSGAPVQATETTWGRIKAERR